MTEVHNGEPAIIDHCDESSPTTTTAPIKLNGEHGVSDHEKVDPNQLNGHSEEPTIPSVPKNVTDKLIRDKIESLNIENHELKTENVQFKTKLGQLEKSCVELKTKSDRASASIESVKRELSSMVIKYATSEKEVINLKKHYAESDRKCKDLMKERDSLQAKIKELTAEKKQLFTNVERSVLEAATLRNENELLKNKLSQADVRVQQLQCTIAELNLQLTEAREKLGRIENGFGRLNQVCHRETGHFKLTDEDEEPSEHKDESDEPNSEQGNEDDQEASNWTDQYLECLEQNKRLTAELDAVISERAHFKEQIEQLDSKLRDAHDQMSDYSRKTDLIESLKNELISKQAAIDSLKDKFDKINCINRDLVTDVDTSKSKEGELLEYTERLTAKLVSLQSEHNILVEKLKCTEEQCDKFRSEHNENSLASGQIQSEYEDYKKDREAQLQRLSVQLQEKTDENGELSRKIDELENDIKIVKRKHISSLKELNKEIQGLKKQQHQSEQVRAKLASQSSQPATENSSTLSSRTNSFTSLNEINQNGTSDSSSHFSAPLSNNNNTHHQGTKQGENNNCLPAQTDSNSTTSSSSSELITSLNDIDKGTLIERILRLQKALVKRTEKIDFLEEHNEQLTEEVRKKSRLLQYYILKEETGALATESMDKNKAYLSRRGGGIMSSLYNSSSTDETVTLERSLEINSKLHAVLEDTLLKNMTLKENLNTLASEIDRLSKSSK